MKKSQRQEGHARLPSVNVDSGSIHFVVETPRGCRNKYKYDGKFGLFRLHTILPVGASFPYDFGYIPQTRAEDGDPLDVLVLMDEQSFPGCVVEGRLIGVIEAEQTEDDGRKTRNDRLIGVCRKSHQYQDVHTLKDLPERVVAEIEHFFISYNEIRGKTFKPLGRHGPNRAVEVMRQAAKAYGKAEP
jgi:inorganic pyrophosphatase